MSSQSLLRARLAGRLADAVEVLALGAVLPVLAVGAAELGGAVDRGRLAVVGAVAARLGGALGLALAGALGARQPLGERLEGRRRLLLGLEERVLLEHLLDFLVQLERRQLEQPDRLLQLRRQRQVLRKADLEGLLHGARVRVPRGGGPLPSPAAPPRAAAHGGASCGRMARYIRKCSPR